MVVTPTHAADILRGGASASADTPASTAATGAAAATAARPTASDTLARTTQAIQAVQAMQAAARALAVSGPNNLGLDPNHAGKTLPNVTDGLIAGGLQVDAAALWSGANQPVQSAASGKTSVTVTQTAQQALLGWSSFNVGKNTTLTFDQTAGGADAGQWIAFNQIKDPSGVPSQILGSIKADGQVYVLNQNGIIFGGSSQVNVHALVASSLPINTNLIDLGLLNNPDSQFLFSSLSIDAGANGTPAFTPATGTSGDVTVQTGAQLTSPTSADHVGGRVALFAPNVTNAGTISTADGQTILAAGQQIGLAAHDSNDPSLRGLDVYVGAGGGNVTNSASALIDAPRASVSIVGKNINQLGAIASTTSVAFNGRIDLLAEYDAVSSGGYSGLLPFFPQATGVVTLGANSVTQVVPELTSTDRVVGAQLALASQLTLRGQAVNLAAKATLLAPSASVTIQAGNWNLTGTGATAQDYFAYTTGQIYLDAGATIDVSGSAAVSAPVSENIVSVQLRGSELANSPLQRDGALRGETVQIDIRQTGTYNGQAWAGTPLADTTGYVALVDHTVGELTTAGGSVKLNAGSSVVVQPGASINVSGGWIDYQGGLVSTTKVLSDGHVYDISQATPDRVYDGIYTGTNSSTSAKWGTTDTTTNAQLGATYENGYIQGGAGGSLAITAPAMAVDGSLLGATVAGPHQRATAPTPSVLSFVFQGQDAALPQNLFPNYSPTPPSITFQTSASATKVGAFSADNLSLPDDRKKSVSLSPDLINANGFGSLTIDNSDGNITLPATVALNVQPGGALNFSAANIDLEGKITAPGGNLSFTTYDRSPFADRALTGGAVPTGIMPDATRGIFTLGASASLNTAGLVVDDRPTSPAAETQLLATKGGSISITDYTAKLAVGSTINASGGVAVSAAGKTTFGNGGIISIKAGQDPKITWLLGGQLSLGATLLGYSGAKGASLSLLAPLVQIGGTTTTALANTLLLTPDFFSRGGFTSFAISGLGATTAQADQYLPGLVIAPGTVLTPVAQSFLATLDTPDHVTLTPLLQPVGVRAPVNLSFSAVGVRDAFNVSKPVVVRGDLVMSPGASIQTDPKASVLLSGETALIQGSVIAPAGTISLSGAKDSTLIFTNPGVALPTVDLTPTSFLSTAGATLLTPDARGYRTGTVLPGGTITVAGNIAAEAGAKLDVSGASGVLDLLPSFGASGTASNSSTTGSQVVATRVDSNGGAISLAGAQMLLADATLTGAAGGATAQGGSLAVSSGKFYPLGTAASSQTPLDVTLTVTQNGATIPAHVAGTSLIGAALLDAKGAPLVGQGYFAADTFNRGGFDALTLKSTVKYSGAVSITAPASIVAGTSGIVFADGAVNLTAPYVAIGSTFQTPLLDSEISAAFLVQGQPFYAAPVNGPGSLNVSAKLIDIGNLSLQNIGKATFAADNGDIRGDGTLDIAGDVTLRAGQIYPPTAVSFTIAAADYTSAGAAKTGSVTIAGSGTRSLPLSAGGTLNVYASTITQGGTLRAPIGTINLGWDGTGTAPVDLVSNKSFVATQNLTLASSSVTSVSAIDPITGKAMTLPYGVNLNGTSWIDPTSLDITVSGAPAKSVHVSAATVTDQAGATIDVRGGGDLFAYRFVSGVGGTKDVLASSMGFAVIPGYAADYAPYAPNNPTKLNNNLGGDTGYVNAGLAVGDRVYLDASSGLPAGVYTLLPARYALVPGAFLVTPKSGTPPDASVALPDGASLVSGYRFNDLNGAQKTTALTAAFEVAPQTVVNARAEYDVSSANSFLSTSAVANDAAVPRLPIDSGQLVLVATKGISILGTVTAAAPTGGRGGLVDISSPVDILIAGPGATSSTGALVLNATELSSFGAESLLIGGVRQSSDKGTMIAVSAGNLTVSNAGAPLTGADVILVANKNLTLTAGADVEKSGASTTAADTLLLGNTTVVGSGDGALVRVSNTAAAPMVRAGVSSATGPSLSIGAGAKVNGTSVTLDSTQAATFDATATVSGQSLAIDSGQITLQLANAGSVTDGGGLVLSSSALQSFQSASSLSLLSYSSLDIYGTGTIGSALLASLALHAAEIRGFNNAGGTVTFAAQDVLLGNSAAGIAPGRVASSAGTLAFNATTLRLGANPFAIDQFANVAFNATGGVLGQGTGGVTTQGALTITAPLVTAATGANQTITAGGALTLSSSSGTATVTGGLGAIFSLTGSSVAANTNIMLPSGALSLHATTGDLLVGNATATRLDVGGTAQSFYDLVKFTNGGQLSLSADAGAVNIAAGSTVSVAAASAGGDAGTLAVSAPGGTFTLAGTALGAGGIAGLGGSFTLDAGRVAGESVGALNTALNTGGFIQSRDLRFRTGNVVIDGLATAHTFNLSADQGSITLTKSGVIDASGDEGGTIGLEAGGSVVLQSGAKLTVAAKDFSAAGKGGAVSLETRGTAGGVIDVQTGSTIDLSVASNTGGSAALGDFTGTLHLRAPQSATSTDLAVNPLSGTIVGASSVVVEGYKVFDLTTSGGAITTDVQTSVMTNGTTFAGNTAALSTRLLGNNSALAAALHVRPGAEIVNTAGDLTLANAWDLSTFRFGPNNSEPGVLTLRAAGNLNFTYSFSNITRTATIGSLSDGFGGTSTNGLWDAPLLAAGSQSWSYRLVSGADLTAADFKKVRPLSSLAADTGSLLLGQNSPALPIPSNPNAPNAASNLRQTVIPQFYQTIRTGTGDIDIVAGRDVQFLNPIATIYTAGTQAAALANFDQPNLTEAVRNSRLGPTEDPIYPAQFSLAGGNVSIAAQNDIAHLTVSTSTGLLVADSSKEMPTNWLYRRGYVDPATGQFGATHAGGETASTAWWIDFSNFFEGVGALGGGNVSLVAGRDVSNVDAVVPTNARMPKGAPDASKLTELGGGDLTVRAGRDIDGGVYYVERGQGTLAAGGSIHTNSTRAAITQADAVALETQKAVADASTWLPTTLFLGKGSFDVSAGGDLLLGPVANAFLLPQGVNNNPFEKTYFSTYAASDALDVSSLTGVLTLRDSPDGRAGSLTDWYQNVLLYDAARHTTYSSYSEPWLRLLETDITPFYTVASLMPATLRATAFSGNLNIVGSLTLSPSATGTLDLASAKSINGVQPNGVNAVTKSLVWGSSLINLSDADPRRVPGITTPLSLTAAAAATPTVTPIDLLDGVNLLFDESGSTQGIFGVIQTKQALHAPGPLHANDLTPAHLYAPTGNISGLTFFSSKSASVIAGRDITDIALYLQNIRASDVSLVAAGRDLIAFDLNSPLRVAAQAAGNELLLSSVTTPGPSTGNPTAGDIQVAGPGTLEVLAGRNFDLGVGPGAGDGTAVGITSIGNARNPNLPFAGADVIAGAGIGAAAALDRSAINFAAFESAFLDPAKAGAYATRYLPTLGDLLGLKNATNAQIWTAFGQLPVEQRDQLALDIFYLVLRDAGRDRGDPASPNFGNYDAGFAAIAALFPGKTWKGDLSFTSREVKTVNGGNIDLFAPGGQLTVGFDIAGSQPVDQGILTVAGGNISIFTHDNVIVGTSRIFTLRGGNEVIWSSAGNIAAGASSKTVQSAPPTRVLIDPQSGDVKTDLAGLATGGGIGVLATVAGVPPGDVDLIAPVGTIDAGDAGIRVSGNLNISALHVVNAANIQVSGASVGTPVAVAPSLGGLASAASGATAASSGAADEVARQNRAAAEQQGLPSIITVEVIGYGGGEGGTAMTEPRGATKTSG